MKKLYQLLFLIHFIIGALAVCLSLPAILNNHSSILMITDNVLILWGMFLYGIANLYSSAKLIFNFLPGISINYRSQGWLSLLLSILSLIVIYLKCKYFSKMNWIAISFGIIALVQMVISCIFIGDMLLYPLRLLLNI